MFCKNALDLRMVFLTDTMILYHSLPDFIWYCVIKFGYIWQTLTNLKTLFFGSIWQKLSWNDLLCFSSCGAPGVLHTHRPTKARRDLYHKKYH